MRLLRPIAVAMLGTTLAVVPSALANSHGASGTHAPKGPRCKHNGTTFNSAGHPNCRRHKGTTGTTGDPTGTTGDPTGDPTGTDTATGDQGDTTDQGPSTVDTGDDDSQS
jgi:hypothetical protein